MPGLALIAEEFSDRVGFITVLIGMDRDRDVAIQIIEAETTQLLTIDNNESVQDSLSIHFESGYIPETILIDTDGNIVARLVGGNADQYRAAINEALNG